MRQAIRREPFRQSTFRPQSSSPNLGQCESSGASGFNFSGQVWPVITAQQWELHPFRLETTDRVDLNKTCQWSMSTAAELTFQAIKFEGLFSIV